MVKFKHILIFIIAIIIGYSCANAQSSYQKYDSVTRGAEYHIVKSQIESNKKQIEMLKYQKSSLNLKDSSVLRSRIQGVVSAKTDENFRLGQKAFLLMDANKVENPAAVNAAFQSLRPKMEYNR